MILGMGEDDVSLIRQITGLTPTQASPICYLLAESETVSEPVRVTPDKLAVAGFRFFAVAA
jgi:hypothetical protein